MPNTLTRWLPAVVAPALVAGAVVLPLSAASAQSVLPSRTPEQVLALVAKSKDVAGFSGTVQQTSALGLPELPSVSSGSSSSGDADETSALELLTGSHTARVFAQGRDDRRVQIIDATGERDLITHGRAAWAWDSQKNTATRVTLPVGSTGHRSETPADAAEQALARVRSTTAVTVDADESQRVAGRDAYALVLTPRTTATTVGSVRISVDAQTGLPLRTAVYARGQSTPAFSIAFSQVTFDGPAASLFRFIPPSGATVRTKTLPDHAGARPGEASRPAVSGSGWDSIVSLSAEQAASGLQRARTSPLFGRLTTAVAGGRVARSALVNVLITDDGRVLAGAVPVDRLLAAAR